MNLISPASNWRPQDSPGRDLRGWGQPLWNLHSRGWRQKARCWTGWSGWSWLPL